MQLCMCHFSKLTGTKRRVIRFYWLKIRIWAGTASNMIWLWSQYCGLCSQCNNNRMHELTTTNMLHQVISYTHCSQPTNLVCIQIKISKLIDISVIQLINRRGKLWSQPKYFSIATMQDKTHIKDRYLLHFLRMCPRVMRKYHICD